MPFSLVLASDHIAGDVLQEHERRPVLVAELDEVRALERRIVEQDAVVGEDADLVAPDIGETADERDAVVRLIFVKAAAVDDSRDDLAHVELLFDVVGKNAVNLLRVVGRFIRRVALAVPFVRPFPLRDDLAPDMNCLVLARGAIVAGARYAGMHVGAAEFFHCDFLAGRGAHQRRAAEKHGARAAHDHVVVRQGRNIGAAGGAVAEHQRELLDAHFRQERLIAENPARHVFVGKNLGLKLQEAARRIAEVDDRQTIFHGDVERADDLLGRQRIPGAAFDRGIVGPDDHLAARHHADADDRACRRRVAAIGHVGGERRQFEERRAGVEQFFDAVARAHFPLPGQTVEVALRADVASRLLLLPKDTHKVAVMRFVASKVGARRADHGSEFCASNSGSFRRRFEACDDLVFLEGLALRAQKCRDARRRGERRELI